MIESRALIAAANTFGLRPDVVEKDYVLGWILAGIYNDPIISKEWIFKGGTCLKKCWFETYRFSEDLDFTIVNEQHLNMEFLSERFATISDWLQEKTGIELPKDLISFDIYTNKQNKTACEGKISYRGPIAPRNRSLPRIKIDLTLNEKIVLPPVVRTVSHAYSDYPDNGIQALCYSYEEIFGEKTRALAERTRPRDLYDVINLFRNTEFPSNPAVIRDVVSQKCDFKGIPLPTLESLMPFKERLSAEWSDMLSHQLPQLPSLESFWQALSEFFEWLTSNTDNRMHLPNYPGAAGESIMRGPIGGLRIPALASSFIEVIRFAASNHLCVELDYTDENGRQNQRLIEPYVLVAAKDGNIILKSINVEKDADRSYRIDRIKGAKVTNRVFTPRYEIQLTPSGYLPVQAVVSKSSSKQYITRKRDIPLGKGPTYIYRCPVCSKIFRHSKKNAKLRKHKTKYGTACSSRVGIYQMT